MPTTECNFNSRDELIQNTVIYGHNVHYDDDMEGERFSQLFHFTDIDFAREHPYVYFSINGDGEDSAQDMVWQVFSVFYTTTDFDYIRINKDFRDPSQGEITDAQLMNIITEARDRSEYDYDVTVSGTDKIMTLVHLLLQVRQAQGCAVCGDGKAAGGGRSAAGQRIPGCQCRQKDG